MFYSTTKRHTSGSVRAWAAHRPLRRLPAPRNRWPGQRLAFQPNNAPAFCTGRPGSRRSVPQPTISHFLFPISHFPFPISHFPFPISYFPRSAFRGRPRQRNPPPSHPNAKVAPLASYSVRSSTSCTDRICPAAKRRRSGNPRVRSWREIRVLSRGLLVCHACFDTVRTCAFVVPRGRPGRSDGSSARRGPAHGPRRMQRPLSRRIRADCPDACETAAFRAKIRYRPNSTGRTSRSGRTSAFRRRSRHV